MTERDMSNTKHCETCGGSGECYLDMASYGGEKCAVCHGTGQREATTFTDESRDLTPVSGDSGSVINKTPEPYLTGEAKCPVCGGWGGFKGWCAGCFGTGTAKATSEEAAKADTEQPNNTTCETHNMYGKCPEHEALTPHEPEHPEWLIDWWWHTDGTGTEHCKTCHKPHICAWHRARLSELSQRLAWYTGSHKMLRDADTDVSPVSGEGGERSKQTVSQDVSTPPQSEFEGLVWSAFQNRATYYRSVEGIGPLDHDDYWLTTDKVQGETVAAILAAHHHDLVRELEAFAERVKARSFTIMTGIDVIEVVGTDVIDAELKETGK